MRGARLRLETKIARWGETLILGGSRQVKGIAQDFQGSLFSTYLSSLEQSQMQRPGLMALVRADEQIAVGETLARGSSSFVVLKIVEQRLGSEVLCKLILGG